MDYESAWLEARALAKRFDALFEDLGLRGARIVYAVGGWTDAGESAVIVRGALPGARELLELLERGVRAAGS
ncbi:hypothetical protein GXW82_16765 [Streptacidiphilus sp. 4-A2]|nr:hypothetical protein [Streptacidiphilus sp. 4-A2]